MYRFIKKILPVVIACLFISSCSGDLSRHADFKRAVSQSFVVTDRGQVTWHLWRQKDMALRKKHSKGYVLSIIDPKTHQIMKTHHKIENGHYIGSANGAEISIFKVYEAEKGGIGKRAEAQITMPNGATYPCELIWYDFTPQYLKYPEAYSHKEKKQKNSHDMG